MHRAGPEIIDAMDGRRYSYEVVRDVWDAGRTDVALVRRTPQRRRLSLHRRSGGESVVLFHRTFRPLLARRRFDAGDDQSLVDSAEFVAKLQQWAERRNDERELTYASDREESAARERDARESAAAADELAWNLRSHTGDEG